MRNILIQKQLIDGLVWNTCAWAIKPWQYLRYTVRLVTMRRNNNIFWNDFLLVACTTSWISVCDQTIIWHTFKYKTVGKNLPICLLIFGCDSGRNCIEYEIIEIYDSFKNYTKYIYYYYCRSYLKKCILHIYL